MRKLSFLAVALASCAVRNNPPAQTPTPNAAPPTASVVPAKKIVAAFALPAPVLGINAPMAGEPDAAKLGEARLVGTTCDSVSKEETDAQIKAMRAAVD